VEARTLRCVSKGDPHRGVQAAAVVGITMPCVLLAHLLTTGSVASLPAALLSGVGVLLVTLAAPARSAARLGLLTGTAQVAAHTVLALVPNQGHWAGTACLPAVGRGAELGWRLAVPASDAGCPPGTMPTDVPVTAALLGMLTAVAIIGGHALAAVITGVLVAGARTVPAAVRALMALVALVIGSWRVPVGGARQLPARADARRAARPQRRPSPALLRGPPTGAFAIA
jgi:hypothetical protein